MCCSARIGAHLCRCLSDPRIISARPMSPGSSAGRISLTVTKHGHGFGRSQSGTTFSHASLRACPVICGSRRSSLTPLCNHSGRRVGRQRHGPAMRRRPVSLRPDCGHRRVTVRAMVGVRYTDHPRTAAMEVSSGEWEIRSAPTQAKLPHLGLSARGTGPYGRTVDRPEGSLLHHSEKQHPAATDAAITWLVFPYSPAG